jgi:hypothetical protein
VWQKWQSTERIVEIKILIAFEDEFRVYQGTIAATIRILRPHSEVETTGLEVLGEKVESFDPRVVISSQPRIASSDGVSAWIELCIDPAQPTKIYAGERCSEMFNPTVDKLVAVLDELELSDVTNAKNWIWLYVTGLTVLIGVEMNAVLVRIAEEKGVTLVQAEDGANTWCPESLGARGGRLTARRSTR